MKKVYIASPVRPVIDTAKNIFGEGYFNGCYFGTEVIIKYICSIASKGCETVKALGHIPISPILAFNGVYDEFKERELIDEACKELLLSCDAIYVVETPYNKESKGIARELEIAKEHGIPVLTCKEIEA